MTNRYVVMVNAALDEFFDWQRNTHGRVVARRLTRSTAARAYRRSTSTRVALDEMSHALQEYRKVQGRPANACDYRIGCRGYARAAMWYVMDGPGLDPLDGEAMTMAHIQWVTRDLAQRAASDAVKELVAPAINHPAITGIVTSTVGALQQVLQQMIDRAKAESDFYEQLTSRTVEVAPPLTADELSVAAGLDAP